MITKYHVDELDLTHLVEEALAIPSGWHEEVYFDPITKTISFSTPMTANSWTEDPEKVGIICSMSVDEWEGLKVLDDAGPVSASIEVDAESDFYDAFEDADKEITVGVFYSNTVRITRQEAIDRIANYIADEYSRQFFSAHELMALYDRIMRKVEIDG